MATKKDDSVKQQVWPVDIGKNTTISKEGLLVPVEEAKPPTTQMTSEAKKIISYLVHHQNGVDHAIVFMNCSIDYPNNWNTTNELIDLGLVKRSGKKLYPTDKARQLR